MQHLTSDRSTMRNIIPIIFVAATVLAGCTSTAPVKKTTTTAGINAVANTDAVVAAPAPVGPNTPAQTLAENVRLGDLGAAFIVILTGLALKRSS